MKFRFLKQYLHLNLFFVLLAAPYSVFAGDEVQLLGQAQWNVPRSADVIVSMAPIQKTVHQYQRTPGSRIRIHYAGGDEGTLWVNELRSWLVSLGIPSRDIELIPGAADPAQLELTVVESVKSFKQNNLPVKAQ